MNHQLFVYGTLRKGRRNRQFHQLFCKETFIGWASVPGQLIQLKDYPGLVLSNQQGAIVYGELYVLNNPVVTLAKLDAYEGCGPQDLKPYEFQRVERDVVLDSGRKCRAWVYVYSGPIFGKRKIRSGDYLKDTLSCQLKR